MAEAQEEEPIHSGQLLIKSGNKWHQRVFNVYPGRVTWAKDDEGEVKEQQLNSRCEVRVLRFGFKKFMFEVECAGGKSLRLAAGGEAEKLDWIHAFKTAIDPEATRAPEPTEEDLGRKSRFLSNRARLKSRTIEALADGTAASRRQEEEGQREVVPATGLEGIIGSIESKPAERPRSARQEESLAALALQAMADSKGASTSGAEAKLSAAERIQSKLQGNVSFIVSAVPKCASCNKKVYGIEQVIVDGKKLHKNCFRCAECDCKLSPTNYSSMDGNNYCRPHYLALLRRERKKSNSTVSQEAPPKQTERRSSKERRASKERRRQEEREAEKEERERLRAEKEAREAEEAAAAAAAAATAAAKAKEEDEEEEEAREREREAAPVSPRSSGSSRSFDRASVRRRSAKRESSKRESSKRESSKRESSKRESSKRESSKRESSKREDSKERAEEELDAEAEAEAEAEVKAAPRRRDTMMEEEAEDKSRADSSASAESEARGAAAPGSSVLGRISKRLSLRRSVKEPEAGDSEVVPEWKREIEQAKEARLEFQRKDAEERKRADTAGSKSHKGPLANVKRLTPTRTSMMLSVNFGAAPDDLFKKLRAEKKKLAEEQGEFDEESEDEDEDESEEEEEDEEEEEEEEPVRRRPAQKSIRYGEPEPQESTPLTHAVMSRPVVRNRRRRPPRGIGAAAGGAKAVPAKNWRDKLVHPWTFKFDDGSGGLQTMHCSSQSERDQWVGRLANAVHIKALQAKLMRAQRIDMMSALQAQAELENFVKVADVSYDGYTERMAPKNKKTWKRRYTVLKDDKLLFYTDAKQKKKPVAVTITADSAVLDLQHKIIKPQL